MRALIAWSPWNVFCAVFVAALLMRYAAHVRGDYLAWWDGFGLGHGDIWIDHAYSLAYQGNMQGLTNIHYNGILVVPIMAAFLKLFGVHGGLMGWGYFLIFSSALLAPIAAATVFTVTRGLMGPLLAGVFVALDPVLTWMGLNGWSDSQTFFSIGLSLLAFVLAAKRLTFLRGIFLGIALASWGIGHGAAFWPSVGSALLTWPLLATRKRWMPAAEGESSRPRGASRFYPAIPLASNLAAIGAVMLLLFVTNASYYRLLGAPPLLHNYALGAQIMAVAYDPAVEELEDLKPGYQWRALRYFPPAIARNVSLFVRTHIADVIPWFGVHLLILVAATVALAVRRGVGGIGWAGLAGLAVGAFFLFETNTASSGVAYAILLALTLAWLFFPFVRSLIVFVLPMIGALLFLIQRTDVVWYRHSNIVVYTLYLLESCVLDIAMQSSVGFRDGLNKATGTWRQAVVLAPKAGIVAALMAVLVLGVVQTAQALGLREEEVRYLRWLGTALPENAVLLTSGNIDPWRVYELTGRTVYYDAENYGRLVVNGKPYEWGIRFSTVFPEARTRSELLDRLRASGKEPWFYRPGISGRGGNVTMKTSPEMREEFGLIERATYPPNQTRFSYSIQAQPITD